MIRYIVSSCLLGRNCKYNGKNNLNKYVVEYLKDKNYTEICPEELGGLETPREPSEIRNGSVFTTSKKDVTDSFKRGARASLDIAIENDVDIAILKSRSPSCGRGKIYDGSFSKKLVDGDGITSKLFMENNLEIYNEEDIESMIKNEEE